MSVDTRAEVIPSPDVERKTTVERQRTVTLVLVAMVVFLDQATKWWAWRYVPVAMINAGGDVLVGQTIGGWYENPVTGALLDLVDFGLLSVAVAVLLRRRRPSVVLVSGSLMLGGWVSNILDRLGMHFWTAPGSVRGAVDFIHLGGFFYNVADFVIVGATLLFLLAVGHWGGRVANRPGTIRAAKSAGPNRPRALVRASAVVSAVALIIAVSVGAVDDGGVKAPLDPGTVSVND
jgi:lipoprotein signal peptidase